MDQQTLVNKIAESSYLKQLDQLLVKRLRGSNELKAEAKRTMTTADANARVFSKLSQEINEELERIQSLVEIELDETKVVQDAQAKNPEQATRS